MPTVNPAYDPQTKTWFLEDPKIEAPTLKALLAELRKIADSRKQKRQEWRIEGYYPLGVEVRMGIDNATLEKRTEQKIITVPGPGQKPARLSTQWNASPTREKPESPPVPPPGSTLRKFFRRQRFHAWDPVVYEQVLDMWAKGIKGTVIAKELGLTTTQVSAHMVPHARAHGDPRAMPKMITCGVKHKDRAAKKESGAGRERAGKEAGISQSSG